MATKAEIIAKDGKAAVKLVAAEAARLQAEDESLTIEAARVQARRNLPSVVKAAERRAGPTTPATADVGKSKPETVAQRR